MRGPEVCRSPHRPGLRWLSYRPRGWEVGGRKVLRSSAQARTRLRSRPDPDTNAASFALQHAKEESCVHRTPTQNLASPQHPARPRTQTGAHPAPRSRPLRSPPPREGKATHPQDDDEPKQRSRRTRGSRASAAAGQEEAEPAQPQDEKKPSQRSRRTRGSRASAAAGQEEAEPAQPQAERKPSRRSRRTSESRAVETTARREVEPTHLDPTPRTARRRRSRGVRRRRGPWVSPRRRRGGWRGPGPRWPRR
jgi:hypothetical protein